MADVALLAQQVQTAPNGYQVPGAQEIILKCVSAAYDGTNAVGSFQPALQIIAPNGKVMGTFPVGITLAAGASADVSWFPFGGVSGGAIRYDVDNTGDWLSIAVTGTNPATGDSFDLYPGPNGMAVTMDNSLVVFRSLNAAGTFDVDNSQGGGDIRMNTGQTLALAGVTWTDTVGIGGSYTLTLNDGGGGAPIHYKVRDLNETILEMVSAAGGSEQLAFFGVTPVVRQATPVTLADVIALLQAYGLSH